MAGNKPPLRVSFIVGSLNKGGAEKQLLYILRALRKHGARTQVLTVTEGEHYQAALQALGVQPVFLGGGSFLRRLLRAHKEVRAFRPHFIQATHFFASAYAGLIGRMTGIPSIGAIRGDLHHDMQGVRGIGRWILHLPDVFIANSNNARGNASQLGMNPHRVFVLQNVIDLDAFDRRLAAMPTVLLGPDTIRAVTVARLVPVKRLERFLIAIASARAQVPELEGLIVGGGPEQERLVQTAEDLGLHPGNKRLAGVRFMGEMDDIPQILGLSDIFVLTSDREGFPNVILEAMAASLPIVSTPAGETPDLVRDGQNGFLVPFDDPQALADRLIRLAGSPALRRTMGNHGRRMVEQEYSDLRLESNLLSVYRNIAEQVQSREVLEILESSPRQRNIPSPTV